MHVVFHRFHQDSSSSSINSGEIDHLLLQVKYVDSYSVTINELETVTTKFKFNSMMRGTSFCLPFCLHSYMFSSNLRTKLIILYLMNSCNILALIEIYFLFSTAPLHGFAFWFDVEFNGPAIAPTNYHSSTPIIENHQVNGSQRKKRTNPNEALVLSTAPEDPPTHWQQVQYLHIFSLHFQ